MLNILCLDIEGGHGGSSRSLFESIRNLDNTNVNIEVWCRRRGPIFDKYKKHNVSVKFMPKMPKVTSVTKFSRNLFLLCIFFIYDWPRSYIFRRELLKCIQRFDIVHFNHESLYHLSYWLNKQKSVKVTMHKRTNLPNNIFSRFQVRLMSYSTNKIIFITENEEKNYKDLGGSVGQGKVIYNIVQSSNHHSLDQFSKNGNLRICTLANYSYPRGTDRLVDVAKILKNKGVKKVLFVVAGDLLLPRSLPGALGDVSKKGGNLSDYANEMGVGNMFLFLGHTSKPEKVLSGCNVLIRPSRENNPWGRDVLEAMSFGLPVIATGTYNRFVEDGVTGFLMDEFEPKKISDCIIKLLKNEKIVERMGEQGKKRVQCLCNGQDRAQDLLQFWREAVK